LARDGSFTFNIDVDCQTAIASKLAPTGDLRWAQHLLNQAPDDRHQKSFATKYYLRHITFVIKTRFPQVFLHDHHAQP
ncbi:hypothetical protein VD17_30715, partial [Pseudomonas fluorescens]